LPTLTRFFAAHGYQTMTLQPWDQPRTGLPSDDIFRRDRVVVHKDLPYHGEPYGVAGVPDQFSLGYFDEHVLKTAPQPRFMFYMATSTHFDWSSVPPFLRDYKRLEARWDDADLVPWAPLEGTDAITDPQLGRYFADVVYEWRALAQFIAARKDEDALIVVLGDHQPLLHCGAGPESFNTPLHVIARDPALLDRFADVGLSPGLYTPPGGQTPLKHEGIYSLLVSRLTGAPYFPAGISASGLRRPGVGHPEGQ
jgi:hypothetical protein